MVFFAFCFFACDDNSGDGVSPNGGSTSPDITWTNLASPYQMEYDSHNRPLQLSDSSGYRIIKFEYCGAKICGYTAYVRFMNEGAGGNITIEACVRMPSGSEYMEKSDQYEIEADKSYELRFSGTLEYAYMQDRTIVVSSDCCDNIWDWTLKQAGNR